jgi:hypothetical protein
VGLISPLPQSTIAAGGISAVVAFHNVVAVRNARADLYRLTKLKKIPEVHTFITTITESWRALDEALRELDRAIQLDGLSASIRQLHGLALEDAKAKLVEVIGGGMKTFSTSLDEAVTAATSSELDWDILSADAALDAFSGDAATQLKQHWAGIKDSGPQWVARIWLSSGFAPAEFPEKTVHDQCEIKYATIRDAVGNLVCARAKHRPLKPGETREQVLQKAQDLAAELGASVKPSLLAQ